MIFGVILDNVFFSSRMERKLSGRWANGIYEMDPAEDDFMETLQLGNIVEATRYFRHASKFEVLRGVTFHDGIVPDNPSRFTQVPIAVNEAKFAEFEYIEVVMVHGKFCWFLSGTTTDDAITLVQLRETFMARGELPVVKGVTPSMRVVWSLHSIERAALEQEKREKEPVNIIKSSLALSGASVVSISKVRRGFEIVWSLMGHTINTLVDTAYRVIEAGFCTSGGDSSQSVRSLPNLLRTYKEEGEYIHQTRR